MKHDCNNCTKSGNCSLEKTITAMKVDLNKLGLPKLVGNTLTKMNTALAAENIEEVAELFSAYLELCSNSDQSVGMIQYFVATARKTFTDQALLQAMCAAAFEEVLDESRRAFLESVGNYSRAFGFSIQRVPAMGASDEKLDKAKAAAVQSVSLDDYTGLKH